MENLQEERTHPEELDHKLNNKKRGYLFIIFFICIIVMGIGLGSIILKDSELSSSTSKPKNTTSVNKENKSESKYRLAYIDNGTLWTINSDGTNRKKITSVEKNDLNALHSWSPNNKYILYDFLSQGGYGLIVVNMSTGRARSIVDPGGIVPYYSGALWLNDDTILFNDGKRFNTENINDKSIKPVIIPGLYQPEGIGTIFSLSPDKQWLLYKLEGSGVGGPYYDPTQYLYNLSTHEKRAILQSQHSVGWYEDGISYIVYNNKIPTYWKSDINGENKIKLTKLEFEKRMDRYTSLDGYNMRVTTPDGKYFVEDSCPYIINSTTGERIKFINHDYCDGNDSFSWSN